MSKNSISSEKIARITQAILQAPNPENSQPWSIVISGQRLEIFHSSVRAKLATFPDDLSIVGLGMVAESLELACSAEGLKAEVNLALENRGDDKAWLTAELSEDARVSKDLLAESLLSRHTDRRRYAGGCLQDEVFQKVKQQAEAQSQNNLYFIDQYPESYLKALKNADISVLEWPELFHDLSQWLRFTDKSILSTRDGMPWQSLLRGKNNWVYYLRSRLWWLSMQFPWLPTWLQSLEAQLFDDSSELTPVSYDDIAAIGCITTVSSSEEDLLNAGRLALRVWLSFNAQGYGFQPMTNLSSIVYPQHLNNFKLPDHLNPLVENSFEILQQTFQFPKSETPIFCFRTGIASAPYPKNARTLRRNDHVTYQDS